MAITNYYAHRWMEMERMSTALVIQSVMDWIKDNFLIANSAFVAVEYLILWQAPEILLSYALILEVLPVTQSEALKENILIGHLKQSYFSAIVAIQDIYTIQRCPYKIENTQRKKYVSSPLVQLMKTQVLKERGLRIWRAHPMTIAAQMIMAIRPSNIDMIRADDYGGINLEMTQNLGSIERLIKVVERKYEALFAPAMKGVWVEAANEAKKDALTIGMRVNNPNLWVTAIWYMENSQKFHKLMKQLAPGSISQVKLKMPKGGFPVFADRPALSEKQMSAFTDELKHSLFAAHATYQRGSVLADSFYEKARTMMHTALQIPPRSIVDVTKGVEVYAYVLWTLPHEIGYIKDKAEPRYLKEYEQIPEETVVINHEEAK